MAKGYLVLEDKTILQGDFFGFNCESSGEVVFSTGMAGYPESLTDPSFSGQILVFTYPLIGNYGVPKVKIRNQLVENFESKNIQVKGVIVTCQADFGSHWQNRLSFSGWLKKEKVPGLSGVDTRFLTQKLRKKGTLLGKILFKKPVPIGIKFSDPNQKNLVKETSCRKVKIYKGGKRKILLIDCGVKASIIRNLLKLKTTVIQVPWNYDPFSVGVKFDAVVISNGPGDPEKAKETIIIIKKLLKRNIPILGICLGSQLLGLASGAKRYKLKFGHRSQNQPCLLTGTNQAFVTSQNHGFSLQKATLPASWREWFTNLNDGTNEGIIHKTKPFFGVQFHPEGNPGPLDTNFVFNKFLSCIR